MSVSPPPLRPALLPDKPRGFIRLLGPGVMLVGLAIGAGELVIWPVTTARFGATVAWAAVLGVSLQLIINLEVGRYTLATGESAYGALARRGRGWVPVFLLLNVVSWILPGWARTCAGAVKVLVVGLDGPGDPWVWTALTFAIVALVMFGPRNVYGWMEKIVTALVVFMLLGLLVIVARLGNGETVAELARGIASVGVKPPDMPLYQLLSAVVFAGAGGTANLLFSYYLRDKGWGMCGRLADSGESNEAWIPDDNSVNADRWSRWFKHMARDQVIFFWLTNLVTILLFIFAALAVLHPAGIVPSNEALLYEEAVLLDTVWGPGGKILFMVIGIACLFTTQLTLLDGVARSCADLLRNNYRWSRRWSLKEWYRGIALGWMVVGTALTWIWGALPPFVFLLSAGFFGGIAMAVYCPLLLWSNIRELPELCRPSMTARLAMSGVSLFYIVFATISVGVVVQQLFAG